MDISQQIPDIPLLKNRLRHAYLEERQEDAQALLAELEGLAREPEPETRQFLELYRVVLYEDCFSDGEALLRLENALSLTRQGLDPVGLSHEEILIMYHIAVFTDRTGCREQAIGILEALANHYSTTTLTREEALRTQPMVLYSLSKYLGLSGEYHRCIAVCDRGIALARESGRCGLLSRTLYNRAWSLLQLRTPETRAESMENLRQAYHLAAILESEGEIEHLRGFWESNFTEKL